MTLHKSIPLGSHHVPYNWEYVNSASRLSASGFSNSDIGKFARQLNDNSIWMLVDTSGIWTPINGSLLYGELDGYAADSTVSEHYIQFSEAIKNIRKDCDGYQNKIDGITSTESEHYIQIGNVIQTILKNLDGYEGGTSSLGEIVDEHYNQHSDALQTILKDLDGYSITTHTHDYVSTTTEHEHYQQHSDAIQIILKDLDGYGSKYDGLNSTISEHYQQNSNTFQSIIKDLDGYLLTANENQHWTDSSQQRQDIRNALDGYSVSVSGLNFTILEHYNQHSDALQTILKELDGYSGTIGAVSEETFEQNKSFWNESVYHILAALDGYGSGSGDASDTTVSEHYRQHSDAIQTILKSLDGYGSGSGDVVKVDTPIDNQLGVWTGDGTIEGDSNLVWDGTGLGIGTDSPDSELTILSTGSTEARINLKASQISSIGFYETTSNAFATITGYWTNKGDGGSGHLALLTDDGTTHQIRIFVTDTGNVGIGNTSAHEKLTISGVMSLEEQDNYNRTHDGYGSIWANSDGKVYYTNDSGINYDLTISASDTTVSEHYQQHSDAIQTILKELDGYSGGGGGLSAEQGADGYLAFFTGSDTIAGDNDLFWDRVNNRLGIGTSNMQSKLHIIGNGGVESRIIIEDDTSSTGNTVLSSDTDHFRIQFYNKSTHAFIANDYLLNRDSSGATDHIWKIGNSEVVRIDSTGLGVKRSPSTYPLEVNGDAGKTSGGTSWQSLSDEELKKNILPIVIDNSDIDGYSPLDRITQLRGILYKWITPENHGLPSEYDGYLQGFIAQEVEICFPEWVKTDQYGMKWLNMIGFEAYVVEALKEIKQEIEDTKNRLDNIEEILDIT